MADEPTASRVCVSDAHDDNGGQRETSCFSLIGPSNDVTLPGNRKLNYSMASQITGWSSNAGRILLEKKITRYWLV